jgi:hypothetical protein
MNRDHLKAGDEVVINAESSSSGEEQAGTIREVVSRDAINGTVTYLVAAPDGDHEFADWEIHRGSPRN